LVPESDDTQNVRYQRKRYKTSDEAEEDVLAALVEKKEQLGQDRQMIVYFDTVKKTVKYAKTLGGLCYHRAGGNTGEEKAIVRQLTEGSY
jgi:hypothetical protein